MTKTQHSQSKRPRKGAAFLLLVVLVLLVVLGASKTMLRGELTRRQDEVGRLRLRSISAAIHAVQRIEPASGEPLRLPLDPQRNQHIEISINEAKSHLIARWVDDGRVVDEVRRVYQPIVEPKR